MSQHTKPIATGSLGSMKSVLGSTNSAPVSPKLNEKKSSRSTSPSISSRLDAVTDARFNLLEQNQQKTSNDLNMIKILLEKISNSNLNLVQTNNNNIESNTMQTSLSDSRIPAIQPIVQTNMQTQNANLKIVQNRSDQFSKTAIDSSKLFGVSNAELSAINSYANANAINNSFGNLNESTILMHDETKYDPNLNLLNSTLMNSNVSSNTNNNTNANSNISFIQQLMPTPATASQPTISEILSSGIKATANKNDSTKIKDVHQLVELLTEQAKSIVTSSDNHSSNEFLIYSLQLFKLLFEYGIHAALHFHFNLMKKVQQNETKLTAEQPMLMFDVITRWKRLENNKILFSTPITSTASSIGGKSFPKQGSGGGARMQQQYSKPFSGTPCSYHGPGAKHSTETCREKDKHIKK